MSDERDAIRKERYIVITLEEHASPEKYASALLAVVHDAGWAKDIEPVEGVLQDVLQGHRMLAYNRRHGIHAGSEGGRLD